MITARTTDSHWEKYGRLDPYFGVINDASYHADRMSSEARDRFFASGREYVGHVLNNVRRHFAAGFRPRRALDFGCGVGRLVLPLAQEAEEVVGVDVSPSMLEEAERNCRAEGVSNVRFSTAVSELPGELEFDFVHSFIVFQHVPVQRGEKLVREILDRLAAGGIGVLHFTYSAPFYARVAHWCLRNVPFTGMVYNVFKKRSLTYPIMLTNFYDLNRLFEILQQQRCGRIYCEFTRHRIYDGVVLYFQKDADAD